MYSVLYEDSNFLIVNKASGVLVHKTKYESEDNLIDLVSKKNKAIYFLSHRIDRCTSGVVLISKNRRALSLVQKLFTDNKVEKNYLAIVSRELPAKKVKISLSIGRNKNNKLLFSNRNSKNYKPAITEVVEIQGKFILAKPITGRTHQIRAHLKDIGCPILNDPIYGEEVFDSEFGQYLHSYSISFVCPLSGKLIYVRAPVPDKFLKFLRTMNIDISEYE